MADVAVHDVPSEISEIVLLVVFYKHVGSKVACDPVHWYDSYQSDRLLSGYALFKENVVLSHRSRGFPGTAPWDPAVGSMVERQFASDSIAHLRVGAGPPCHVPFFSGLVLGRNGPVG